MKKFLFTIIVLFLTFSAAAEEPSPLKVFHYETNPVDLCVTNDGKSLFYASYANGIVEFDVESGDMVRVLKDGDDIYGYRPFNLRISNDNSLLLTGDRYTDDAELWNLTSNEVLQHLGPHYMLSTGPGSSVSTIYAVGISSTHSYCVTWGTNSETPFPTAAHFWDTETGEKCFFINPGIELYFNYPDMWHISSDDRYLFLGREVWDIETRKKVQVLDPSVYGIGEPIEDRDVLTDVYVVEEKEEVVIADLYSVTLWNFETGEFIQSFGNEEHPLFIEVSPDRRWLMGLTYSTNGYIYVLYDFQTGNKIAEIKYPHLDSYSFFKFHPNSHQVFSIVLDEIHLWDINDYLHQSSNLCAENYR
ncbi:MAG: hypothetical protein P9L94_01080 [Candidatus Hinthialibacter antarcticus]|nr:hypothetical protein [Candidatus Hinthialibacter antarcticus]